VALAASHRVRSPILIGTAARSPRDALAARAKAAEKDGMASQVAPSLMRWFLPETIAENRWPVRYARSLVLRARVEEWAAAWRAMAGLDVLDRLPGLAMPALVLAGAQDKSAPAELAMQPIAAALPSAEYRLMDPGSHLMAIEQPDAVAATILAFRTRIEDL
jgi:3-oxoadipate enol-lactonase